MYLELLQESFEPDKFRKVRTRKRAYTIYND